MLLTQSKNSSNLSAVFKICNSSGWEKATPNEPQPTRTYVCQYHRLSARIYYVNYCTTISWVSNPNDLVWKLIICRKENQERNLVIRIWLFISAIYHPFSNSSQTVSWDKSFNPVATANEFLCLCLQRGLIIVETFWCTLRTRKGNKRTSDPKVHLTLYPLDSIGKYVYRVHGRSQLIFFYS